MTNPLMLLRTRLSLLIGLCLVFVALSDNEIGNPNTIYTGPEAGILHSNDVRPVDLQGRTFDFVHQTDQSLLFLNMKARDEFSQNQIVRNDQILVD
jgi:hypothetical protein